MHASAFGISIPQDKFDDFIVTTNEALADYDFSTTYKVDAIYSSAELDPNDVISIYQMNDLWTQGIEEPLIAVNKFKPTSEEMMTFSTVKFGYTIELVGTCNFSTYDNTPQIMIKDYNLTKNVIWDF